MNNHLVSIIIPVYNAEKYLDRCVESLCRQTYNNIQIVLVEDGAKDNSAKLCDAWGQRDSRIKVIHKENAGAGFARNTGIEAADGEYIMFADADDYMLDEAVEKALNRIVETEADICYYGCFDVKPDGQSRRVPPKKLLYKNEETIEYVKYILGQEPDSSVPIFGGVAPWSGIVRRCLLMEKNIRFPSERECLSEDTYYNIEVCLNAKIIAVEPSCLYCYCQNDYNSLSSSYNPERFDSAKDMYTILKKEVVSIEDDEMQERLYRMFMQHLIACLKLEVVYKERNGQKTMKNNLKRMVNDDFVQECMHRYPVNRMPIKQRLLFSVIKFRSVYLTYLLVSMRIK